MIKVGNYVIALQHLGHRSDTGGMHTLEGIICYLPFQLRGSWAEEANAINRDGRRANFEDLTDFINWQVKLADSRFGRLAQSSREQWRFPLANRNMLREVKADCIFGHVYLPFRQLQLSERTRQLAGVYAGFQWVNSEFLLTFEKFSCRWERQARIDIRCISCGELKMT